jgi:thiamine kinase-like enzyme
MKVICIYDNHIKPNVFIKSIVGEKTFGEVILKRKSIRSKFLEFVGDLGSQVDEVLGFDNAWQLEELLEKVRTFDSDARIFHIFSSFVIEDVDKARIIIEKVPYMYENYLWISAGNCPTCFVMKEIGQYCDFLEKYASILNDNSVYQKSDYKFEMIETDAFFNLAVHSNFLQYISGGFDARFFNAVTGDEFVVTKSSRDKKKIKAEYEFWHFLPDHMKSWFVMPYNYRETEELASYDMERYHMTDLAIRWVHGAIDLDECDKLLKKAFYFISIRERKSVSREEYQKIENYLYLDKLDERIETLKKHECYPVFREFISRGGVYDSLDEIVNHYKRLYERIRKDLTVEQISVIGHGDLCFSNMLFNKEADLLKLIDPKGALEEDKLWTNPYYDVVKLSHSICGRYDFFNNGLYQISLDGNLRFQLNIDFDNGEFKNLFRKYAEDNGFSYMAIRIYESSLFLSMLPLHMDNPQKVFGFILNAIAILKEVEICLNK